MESEQQPWSQLICDTGGHHQRGHSGCGPEPKLRARIDIILPPAHRFGHLSRLVNKARGAMN